MMAPAFLCFKLFSTMSMALCVTSVRALSWRGGHGCELGLQEGRKGLCNREMEHGTRNQRNLTL